MVGPSNLSTKMVRQTLGDQFLETRIFERIRMPLDRIRDNSDTQTDLKIRVMWSRILSFKRRLRM